MKLQLSWCEIQFPLFRIAGIGKAGNLILVYLAAACRGDLDFVRLLLSGGAQVDFRGSDGATPLLAAADGGFAK